MSFDLTTSQVTVDNNISIVGSSNDPTNGPNTIVKLNSDNFPVYQQLNLDHDNIALNFDSYYDTDSTWKSGYYNSQFNIYKTNDQLSINFSGNVSQGSALTWTPAITINNTGNISLGNGGTFFGRLLTGSTTFGSSSGSSGTLQTTIGIGATMGNTAYTVLLTPEVSGNVSEVYTASVYNKTTSAFGVNMRRVDNTGGSWTSNLVINWTIIG